jgi:hypothetical protein
MIKERKMMSVSKDRVEKLEMKKKASVLMRGEGNLSRFFSFPRPSALRERNFLMPPVLCPGLFSSMHREGERRGKKRYAQISYIEPPILLAPVNAEPQKPCL